LPNCITDLFLQPPYLPNQVQFVPPPQWNPQVIQPPPLIIIVVDGMEGGESESIDESDSKLAAIEDGPATNKSHKDNSVYNYEEAKLPDNE
jgi:hypothetical protein